MNKIVVTTGQKYTDIDALACAIAYTELLKLRGVDAYCVLPGPLNKSVSSSMREWDLDYLIKPPKGNSDYILVDISDPLFFANFVDIKKVIEVYDHRPGFEKYWQDKLRNNSHIEQVGSCTTLIWEKYQENNLENEISTLSANLIYTTTFSHTLNFKSSVTTKRDIKTFDDIAKYTNLPKQWIDQYFIEQESDLLKNPVKEIINDTKLVTDMAIGQLELWDSQQFFKKYLPQVEEAFTSFNTNKWFLTSPSISEGKNYLYTKDENTKTLLKKIMGAKFQGNIGTTTKLWLRKEILAKII